jgi:hypothetical protein
MNQRQTATTTVNPLPNSPPVYRFIPVGAQFCVPAPTKLLFKQNSSWTNEKSYTITNSATGRPIFRISKAPGWSWTDKKILYDSAGVGIVKFKKRYRGAYDVVPMHRIQPGNEAPAQSFSISESYRAWFRDFLEIKLKNGSLFIKAEASNVRCATIFWSKRPAVSAGNSIASPSALASSSTSSETESLLPKPNSGTRKDKWTWKRGQEYADEVRIKLATVDFGQSHSRSMTSLVLNIEPRVDQALVVLMVLAMELVIRERDAGRAEIHCVG